MELGEFVKKAKLIGRQSGILKLKYGWDYSQTAKFLMQKYNIKTLAEYDELIYEYETLS
tara:strand:+ start:1002 stop:1178 length:177 start_codon:yes stop_codon:yes gene_type:complete